MLDILRGELERLFSLDELTSLSRDVLGFDPDSVGGTAAKASFARALTDLCAEQDALEALAEAILASRADADARLRDLSAAGAPAKEELAAGAALGPYTITRKVGEGSVGIVYAAKSAGHAVTLKVLRREAARDRRALHRFLTATRLVGRVTHDALPHGVVAGTVADGGPSYVAYDQVDAQPLAARIARTGPMHLNEARPLLKGLLEGLAALHEQRLAHGDLKLENILVARGSDGAQKVLLVDAGTDRLRLRARSQSGQSDVIASIGAPKTMAPEQVRGQAADARTDLYGLGAVLYEVLTGKPVFAAATPLDAAVAHLSQEPAAPSTVAPKGWVSADVDRFVLALLHKDPAQRPVSALALLEALEGLGKAAAKRSAPAITDEEIDTRIAALAASPEDADFAVILETAIEEGGDATKVAEALAATAEALEPGDDDAKREAKKALWSRAARIFETAKQKERAEHAYAAVVALDPSSDVALARLEDLRRDLGKFDELVEMLLSRSEAATSPKDRARAMAEIGRVYAHDLKDASQAVVAWAQAFCEDPATAAYADDLERAAGSDATLWNDAITTCAHATTDSALAVELKNVLFERLARWYDQKLSRPDLSLPCWQAIVATDPGHDAALAGMAAIYRKAQQWPELGAVLLRRADAAKTPARGRDLRAEAADLLENKLSDHTRAREVYEQVLAEDPGHEKATEALGRILERTGDFAGFVKLLERRAEALRGDEKCVALARIAAVYEDQLGDQATAVFRYESILSIDDKNVPALKGLDRIYSRAGKYHELLAVLEREVVAAATPRQKINLHERIAGVWDEEFLDHAKAAEACEAILAIDAAHDAALSALARHYRALDRWEDVAAVYEKHLKLAPDDARRAELALALGRVLAEQIGSPERATRAYEIVIEADPHNAGALEALARLREVSGDAVAALSAIEMIAAKATTPEAKAEQWMRAARLLDSRGDKDGAIERYRQALDANPRDPAAAIALRSAYAARGDVVAAVDLIAREIGMTEGNLAKAALLAEMAKLCKERLKDGDRARNAARDAVDLDPTSLDALVVLGDLAFESERFREAAGHYETIASRVDSMPKADATRVLVRWVDSLSKTGSTEKALAPVDTLLRLAPDDVEALSRVARVTFEHGDPKRSFELHQSLLERFHDRLIGAENAEALYRLGESARRAGDLDGALKPLLEAAEMDSTSEAPLTALAKVYEAKEDWESVVRVKTRRLDVAAGEERYAVLLDIGDVLASRIGDRTRAAKTYVAALEEHPDDRRLLSKLMQLYSEEKDWSKLVDVVLRLADFVEEPAQKAKYVHTAAILCATEIKDLDAALAHYDRVLELDPSMDRALDEATALRRERGDHLGVERLLKTRLDRASAAGDRDKMLATFTALGELYQKGLGWMSEAIDAFEAAQTLDPDDRERNELLGELYASDPAQYLDKAVTAQRAVLRRTPFRAESYKLLRKLYTDAKRADAAWCLCQALVSLELAEPDEQRFFERMRTETAAPAQNQLSDEDWTARLIHEDADPLLTSLFAAIEPAIIAARSQSFESLGFDPSYAIDLASSPYTLPQTLYYAASVVGLPTPPTFENANDPGGLSFLHAQVPAIMLGQAALGVDVPPQVAAFVAARHLAYYRPGLYVRHLVPTGTGLKAWLFAAIRLIAPNFPVPGDIEGQVRDNGEALTRGLVGQQREHLASAVSKLLQGGGSLDLKRWVAGVDLTADRAGFVCAHDLGVASEAIKASGDDASSVGCKDRVKELTLFAVDERYFAIRSRLSITIDG